MKDRLKKILEYSGLTQREFAESIGTTQATLSRQLSGTHKIDKQVALSIQAVYGVNPIWLLTGEGEMLLRKSAGNSFINTGVISGNTNVGNVNNHIYKLSDDEEIIIEQLRKKKNKKILDAIKALLGAGIVFGLFWLAR